MAATSTSKSFSIDHILYGGVPKMTNSAAVVMTTSTSQQETRAYLTQSYPLAKTHHADTYYPIAWPMQQQQPAWLPASYPLPIDLTWNKRVDAAADWNQFSLAYLNANDRIVAEFGSSALMRTGRRFGRKGGQIRFTHEQSSELERTFTNQRYLTPSQRRSLANRLALTERQVKTWFQNRRAKWRRTRKATFDQDPATPEEDKETQQSTGEASPGRH